MNRCTVRHRPGSKAGRECVVCNPPRGGALAAAARPPTLGLQVGYGEVDQRLRLAGDPATPADVLEVLAEDEHWGVRRSVSSNPSTPSQVLEALAGDDDWNVRRAVAWHSSTPPHVLETLAGDGDAVVRGAVASNSSTPSQVLEALATDGEWAVRGNVASNPSAPLWVLETLAKDGVPWARRTAARNPAVPLWVLETLVGDDDCDVSEAAQGEVDRRIRERFGLDPRNTDAIEMLRSMPWWELTRDDPQVQLVLALSPDPAADA